MRIGLYLVNQYPNGVGPERALAEGMELLRAARDGGWDAVWTGHHYLTSGFQMLSPLSFLGYIARETGEMELGVAILLLTASNPVAVAEELATIDVLSGGRLAAGVGLGYRDIEFNAFGVQRGQRVHRFVANLEILKSLWVGEEVNVDMPWCNLQGARLSVLPTQRPRPQLWMGATSDQAVRRAATLTDGWIVNPAARLDAVEAQLPLYREARIAAGLPIDPPSITAIREVFCAKNRNSAIELSRPYLERKYQMYGQWGQGRALTDTTTLDSSYEQLAEQRFIVGSPEDCYRAFRTLQKRIGPERLILRCRWPGMPVDHGRECIQLLSREVLPALQGG